MLGGGVKVCLSDGGVAINVEHVKEGVLSSLRWNKETLAGLDLIGF